MVDDGIVAIDPIFSDFNQRFIGQLRACQYLGRTQAPNRQSYPDTVGSNDPSTSQKRGGFAHWRQLIVEGFIKRVDLFQRGHSRFP